MSTGKGWIPEKYDPNDKPYRSRLEGLIKPSVNLAEEHSDWFKEVYNQHDSGSCVANASAAAYRFLARKMNQDAQSDSHIMDDPSRLFVYYNARILPELENAKVSKDNTSMEQPPQVTDIGTHNRSAFKGLNIYGVCAEEKWPFKFTLTRHENGKMYEDVNHVNDCPPVDAYETAKASHAIEYCRLDPDHTETVENQLNMEERKAVGTVTLMQLKQCLSEGYPVVFGFRYFWKDLPGDGDQGEYVLPAVPESRQHQGPDRNDYGGHAVLAIGYDSSRQQVLCQNSWGSDWSNEGKFWIPYSWISDWEATDDFWMVRLIERK